MAAIFPHVRRCKVGDLAMVVRPAWVGPRHCADHERVSCACHLGRVGKIVGSYYEHSKRPVWEFERCFPPCKHSTDTDRFDDFVLMPLTPSRGQCFKESLKEKLQLRRWQHMLHLTLNTRNGWLSLTYMRLPVGTALAQTVGNVLEVVLAAYLLRRAARSGYLLSRVDGIARLMLPLALATMVSATPLLLTGLAAAAAFRMQTFNIGAEGQLYLGAIGASGIGIALHDQSTLVILIAMIVAGVITGAAWAAIAPRTRAWVNP